MQLMLTGLGKVEIGPSDRSKHVAGMKRLKVKYCGVCRTDAKMWKEGHRDLAFPRVPGHEILAEDDSGRLFTVWPGNACGCCDYCRNGRENLCETMTIMGFHFDGGFSENLIVPERSLIPVPSDVPSHLACFTEPVGCVINAMDKLALKPSDRIVIFGGGTVGLIAALVAKAKGAIPVLLEKNAEKIAKASSFLDAEQISCFRETSESEFDCVINACPDPIAFSQGMTKLAKGGRFAFFSGLTKNQHTDTNLLNLIHYKEFTVKGAYGLSRKNMIAALDIIRKNPSSFEMLIEAFIPLQEAEQAFSQVLAGNAFKYILDLTDGEKRETVHDREKSEATSLPATASSVESSDHGLFDRTIDAIKSVPEDLLPAARHKMDNKTKPLGALGLMESLAIQMCLIQNSLSPRIDQKNLFVFAADHGITEEGVSAYPSEVTAQMVFNFLSGGAAINVLCQHHGIDICIVDVGVNAEMDPHPDLINRKIRRGARNSALEPAMTRTEMFQALEVGMSCFFDAHKKHPMQILGLGEMGIGNTTAAAAIISSATGITPEAATGRGTGVDDAGLRHKVKVIQKVLDFHKPDSQDGLDILGKVGGLEIAGIAGAVLAAASEGVAVVLDGVISTAAGLIAHLIRPEIGGYLISGHRSIEVAQAAALEKMGLRPVVDLDMRLGEGTGDALTIDIVDAACRIMNEMASFDEAGVSNKEG